jgi:hypothetical protein
MITAKPGSWIQWQEQPHVKVALLLNSNELRECIVCKETKETVLATVHAYHEGGQHTPMLKIDVCEECLSGG